MGEIPTKHMPIGRSDSFPSLAVFNNNLDNLETMRKSSKWGTNADILTSGVQVNTHDRRINLEICPPSTMLWEWHMEGQAPRVVQASRDLAYVTTFNSFIADTTLNWFLAVSRILSATTISSTMDPNNGPNGPIRVSGQLGAAPPAVIGFLLSIQLLSDYEECFLIIREID